jgi:hypothetical protein
VEAVIGLTFRFEFGDVVILALQLDISTQVTKPFDVAVDISILQTEQVIWTSIPQLR